MALDLEAIRQALAHAPLTSPPTPALGLAVLDDLFRRAGHPPLPETTTGWLLDAEAPQRQAKLALIGWMLNRSPLGPQTIIHLKKQEVVAEADLVLRAFFASIENLTAEMIRDHATHQEVTIRQWATAWGVGLSGETTHASTERLKALTGRETDARKVDKSVERARRRAALKAARERETAARGWRE